MKRILDIPNIRQRKNHCGPACLSMAADYFGYDYSQKKFADYWGQEEVREEGVAGTELAPCARDFGFTSRAYHNLGLAGIIKFIDRDIPIIARVTLPQSDGNKGWAHFVLLKGYETNPTTIWINDPLRVYKEREQYETFKKKWRIKQKGLETNQYDVIIHV